MESSGMKLGWGEYLLSVIYKKRENKTGTLEEESGALFESRNAINRDARNGVDVMVEEVNVNVSVNVNGDVGHVKDAVIEEVARVERLERLELQNNHFNASKIEEDQRVEHGECNDSGNDDGDSNGSGNGNEVKNRVYPLRPYAEDCPLYTKTGTCKFGQKCRHNHPLRRGSQSVGNKQSNDDGAEKIGSKYYQKPGRSKKRDAGKHNHSARTSEKERLQLNFLGLPIRPSAQECKYYLQHGYCAFGTNCRFNHPEPSVVKEHVSGDPLGNGNSVKSGVNSSRNCSGVPLQSFGGPSQGTSVPPNNSTVRKVSPNVPETSSYHQTMPEPPRLNQSEVISSSSANKFPHPRRVVNNVSKRVAPPVSHCETPMQTKEFSEQPRRPDCELFVKNGNCKYQSSCRYNHPTSQKSKLSPPVSSKDHSTPPTMLPAQASRPLNSNSKYMSSDGMSSTHHQNPQMQNIEFPERAGQPQCKSYMKTGQCKLKSACRYDHPRSQTPASPYTALNEKGLPLRPLEVERNRQGHDNDLQEKNRLARMLNKKERKKKEAAERQAKLDESAAKQRQKEEEIEEKKRKEKEQLLAGELPAPPSEPPSRPHSDAPAATRSAPGRYVPRHLRGSTESSSPRPPPASETDRWGWRDERPAGDKRRSERSGDGERCGGSSSITSWAASRNAARGGS